MKKRILFILHLPPPVHGAAVVGVSIKESILINDYFDTDYINLSTSSSMTDINTLKIGKVTKLVLIQSQIIKALFTKKYDLCYVTLNSSGTGFYKDLITVFILKLFRKKVIYHFHNKGISKNSDIWMNNLLYKFAFNNTKSILLSKNLYSDFKKYLNQRDVYYCPNGVSAAAHPIWTENLKDQAGFKCNLLFLSNMVVEKGVLILLEACKLLKQEGYNFECHFVGAWSNITQPYFQNLVSEYKLTDNIFAHGAKFGDEKNIFFLNADIFILPTYNECFPLVLLEAMSYGLPVVSTAEGGIPDIIVNNETGFVVEKNSVADLTSKLEMLIKNPGMRANFGNEGRKRFLNLFTTEKFEQNLINILESTICNNKKEA